MAILSSDTFDATTVDPETVTLAGASVKMVGKSGKFLSHEEGMNEDGLLGSVCQVHTEQVHDHGRRVGQGLKPAPAKSRVKKSLG